MKRNEIIQKLINEGFSAKTLVNFTDKQLNDLSSRMLSEQSTTQLSAGYSTPDEYGQAVFKALGPNFLVSTHNIDYTNKELPGTYNGYFLQKFKYGSKWGNDGVSLNFDAYYNNKEGKRKNAILTFNIIFSKILIKYRILWLRFRISHFIN
jgi:hypothetical protein